MSAGPHMGRHCAVQPAIGAYGAAERQSGRSDSSPEASETAEGHRRSNVSTLRTAFGPFGQLSDPLDSFRTGEWESNRSEELND